MAEHMRMDRERHLGPHSDTAEQREMPWAITKFSL
jgi:hypothetical protein